VVTHVLRRGDYSACCCSSGEDAIEAASNQHFDLILMDLQMPAMDGFQTTAKIRCLPGYATTPIVALTANVSDEYRQLCRSHGMQGFVPKPVQAEELLAAMAKALQ
jgi:two-component system sensor histidine kinase/response regulator